MTIQKKQESSFHRTMSLIQRLFAVLREILASIIRELIPPRAWLRAVIVEYLGTKLLLFALDISGPWPVTESSRNNAILQTASAVKQEPSIPSEALVKAAPHEELVPIASAEESTVENAKAANSSLSVWRITLVATLVLLAIEFVVNLAASLMVGCVGWIRPIAGGYVQFKVL